MKRQILLSVLLSAVLPMFSQLTWLHNGIRQGDQLVKQQVEFKDPGDAGVNRVWNFSDLVMLNDEYHLNYTYPISTDTTYVMGYNVFSIKKNVKDDLFVASEHNTMYYYKLSGDSLLLLGHENPAVKLEYTIPFLVAKYPVSFGHSYSSAYQTKGLYSGTIPIEAQGEVQTKVDAFGKMILPKGDTLNPVLRIKTVQTIKNTNNNESITDQNEKLLETCYWYTKGYRYPIFETIQNINKADSTVLFQTAFYYPPQEHLYLDTDPENQALLNQLWDYPNNENYSKSQTIDMDKNNRGYTVYPNPIIDKLNISYALREYSRVSIQIFSLDGKLIKQVQKDKQHAGDYNEQVDCTNIPSGSYILKISSAKNSFNDVIIKK